MLKRHREPHLLVMVHAVREDREKRAYGLLLDRLQADGHQLSIIAWDRGKSVLDLDQRGPVGDIEDINRWRLPIWLAKSGLRPVARVLRNARIKWWWARAHQPTQVLVLGLIRPEMRHYLPPGAHVGVVLGWREPEEPESLDETLAIADAVLAADQEAADHCRSVDPDVDVLWLPHLWPHLHWSLHLRLPPADAPARAGVATGTAFVLGLGSVDWSGGAEQFVAMAGRVLRASPTRNVEFGWVGGHPDGPSHYPYRFDVNRLGLADRFHWLGERDDYHEFVRRADVLVVTCHEAPVLPFDPTVGLFVAENRDVPAAFAPKATPFAALVDVVEVPVVRFETEAAAGLTEGQGRAVAYPDTAALAAAVDEALAGPRPTTVKRALTHLLGATPS